MTYIDMTHWLFSIGGSNATLAGTLHYSPPTVLAFPTTLDLLLHLANPRTHQPEIQSCINRRLKADPVVQSWHRQRAYLKSVLHFPKYKGRHYDAYHMAARAVASNDSTTKQQAVTTGLNQEIAASTLIVPTGQHVLHGRSDLALHQGASYPSFISTSLDPVVAVNSAMRRAGMKQTNGLPVVYILTLRDPFRVVWGNGGKSHEWELLMETNLSCVVVNTHSGKRFEIVEATIGH